ncbi:aminodeoxychorismate synthase component I [Nitratifractor sp.]|uniref:aminodeoxychorismate synthase component I n=1 Tax=Nitratifractor sp. TaxID=2268144 RepID=UPI0025D01781|nr:aminodeoxychorismate synthase component I [Nitratifractor sp.]
MTFYETQEGFRRLNALGTGGEDFFFLISFDRERILAEPLDQLPCKLLYRLDDWSNEPKLPPPKPSSERGIRIFPPAYTDYLDAFERVQEEIRRGNTYLLNLTFASPIETQASLEEIYYSAQAPYKLHLPGLFTCFSPEKFITIRHGKIFTYPMKGTIDASLPDAAEKILQDPKETAEHVMITDLMRNDLNRVSRNVRVTRFRYLDKIPAGDRDLYQVSSEIIGELSDDWRAHIGSILAEITPAGSISGTPKRKTLEIIERIENYQRGFYTGVFGVCKREELRSAVLIRFLEKAESEGLYYYKSGGGITLDSDPEREYQELLSKIYLP